MNADTSSTRIPTHVGEDRAGRNVDGVIEYILERIRTGQYAQGQQLVARDIARRLDVSVAPVREALHRLWGEGVVEFQSNRSARIRRLAREDVLHALEVWETHAGLMARLAAQRIKIRDNAERLHAARSEIASAQKRPDPQQYFRAVMRYQKTLADISENPYVEAIRQRLHTEFWTPVILHYIPKTEWSEYLRSFERIDAAIHAGAPDEAEREYRRHVRWAAGLMRAALPRDPAPLPAPVAPTRSRTRRRRA